MLLVWNLLCRPGWPLTHSAGTKGACHRALLRGWLWQDLLAEELLRRQGMALEEMEQGYAGSCVGGRVGYSWRGYFDVPFVCRLDMEQEA